MRHTVNVLASVGTCLTTLFLATPTLAAVDTSNWYLGVSGDATWVRHSDTGGGGNIALGYRFKPTSIGNFRAEAEAGYHAAPGSGNWNDTHYFTYMGNVYYDFTNAFSTSSSGWHVVPYIGAGIGDAAVSYGQNSFTNSLHHNEDQFAWQGMAGLTLASNASTDWSVGYRYLGTNDRNIDSNNVEAGVRFHF